ncbi:MAG: histidine triad nucleotide-binding protein [Fibromonadaceae bacterium]|jgi:histidine triad (HIT) family protein|nr:histidine triad nucleotide-binding protein [Fibromonadaceae bacterium]
MDNCLFCKIAHHEIPSEVLYEDDLIMAFMDISPQAPLHFLVVPKKHIDSLMDAGENDKNLLGHLLFMAQKIAKEHGCEEKGARFVLNCKTDGGQTVGHLHLHVLGKRMLYWPPG